MHVIEHSVSEHSVLATTSHYATLRRHRINGQGLGGSGVVDVFGSPVAPRWSPARWSADDVVPTVQRRSHQDSVVPGP